MVVTCDAIATIVSVRTAAGAVQRTSSHLRRRRATLRTIAAPHNRPPERPVAEPDPSSDGPAAPDALGRAADLVGDRWTLRIVQALLDGPARYGELAEAVAPISPNVLAARLKQLEADGLVLATPYQQRPARYAYELTARGAELGDVLRLLAQWGQDAAGADRADEALRHEACGTPVEAVLWCPTCERVVDGEADDLHHL